MDAACFAARLYLERVAGCDRLVKASRLHNAVENGKFPDNLQKERRGKMTGKIKFSLGNEMNIVPAHPWHIDCSSIVTMKKITTLHELFVDQLRDLYSAETQLTKALPKMADAAHDKTLKKGFETHLGRNTRARRASEENLR